MDVAGGPVDRLGTSLVEARGGILRTSSSSLMSILSCCGIRLRDNSNTDLRIFGVNVHEVTCALKMGLVCDTARLVSDRIFYKIIL